MAPKPKAKTARRDADLLRAVGELLDDLTRLGYEPTLVGGMALVVLGLPRVTKDFDFLVIEEAREQNALIQMFYRHGFELASRLTNTATSSERLTARRSPPHGSGLIGPSPPTSSVETWL